MRYLGEPDESPAERERVALGILDEFLKEGDLSGAKQYCQWVLEKSPFHPTFNFHLGNIENQFGNYEAAKQAFILSHRHNPAANPRTLFNIGYVCFRLNEFDLAIGAYQTALQALEQENNPGESLGDNLKPEMVYHNMGIAQCYNACDRLNSDPEKAILDYRDALISFNNVLALVDADITKILNTVMELEPEINQLEFRNRHRAQSPVFGFAFEHKLRILKDLIKLDVPDKENLVEKLNEYLNHGLNSPALVDHHREIQHIQWEWQQDCGLAMDVEHILSDEAELRWQLAVSLMGRLDAILAWHREPIDWVALKQRYSEGLRYLYEQHTAQLARTAAQEELSDELLPEVELADDLTPLQPVEKKSRIDREQSTPEEVQNPVLARLLAPHEKDKVDRLNEEISAHLRGLASYPHAHNIMMSCPAFLSIHGFYRIEQGMLAHVIHESYTYFDQQALMYIRSVVSSCGYRLQIAGFKVAQNNLVEALAIINLAMTTIGEIYLNNSPRYIGEVAHQGEPEIQIRRRQDLQQIAKFHICHTLFKGELLRGVVLHLLGNLDQASDSFGRCYEFIEVMEVILKSPQSTETFRLLKGDHQELNVSKLHRLVRDHERKIPEQLKARIKCLEELFQRDELRININNVSIPFPYDMFREKFSTQNQDLRIPEHANISDHVLSLCYLTPEGTPQVTSIHFNSKGVAFDLYNIAKSFGLHYDSAKTAKEAVVSKINYGKQIYQQLEVSKQQKPSLTFMKFVQPHKHFDNELDKHSEQAFYLALDRHDPVDLVTRWSQASNGKFTPDCTVIACFSNMRSLKTGCPNCKASAIATQNPRPDDNTAFLNRLHATLKAQGFKTAKPEPGKPKLLMVTRIRAFSKDAHATQNGLHQNPVERDLTQHDNLAIVEMLDGSSYVSGFRGGII